jgi:hypothetical protein
MIQRVRRYSSPLLLFLFFGAADAQRPKTSAELTELPEARTTDDLAKAKSDHEENVRDAARLAQLVGEVKEELEAGGQFALSVSCMKKAEEIEKLSKKLHARLKGDSATAPSPPPWVDLAH